MTAKMKTIRLGLALGLMLSLCGCAHSYVMKLNNGLQVTSSSKPKLKDGFYCYKDASGKERYMPQSRVLLIEPSSMATEEKARFNPSTSK
jgi:hypothetical protein